MIERFLDLIMRLEQDKSPLSIEAANAIRELLRGSQRGDTATYGRLTVHFDGQDPEVDSKPLRLPRRERDILMILAKTPGVYFTKERLVAMIYGDDICGSESSIEMHISKLRSRLRRALGDDSCIETERYVGYAFIMDGVARKYRRSGAQ